MRRVKNWTVLQQIVLRSCSSSAMEEYSETRSISDGGQTQIEPSESHSTRSGLNSVDLWDSISEIRKGWTEQGAGLEEQKQLWRTAIEATLPSATVLREVDTFLTVLLGPGLRSELSQVIESRTPNIRVEDWFKLLDCAIYCGVESNSTKHFVLSPTLTTSSQLRHLDGAHDAIQQFKRMNEERCYSFSEIGPSNSGRLQAALWQTSGVAPLSLRDCSGDGSGINLVLRALVDWLSSLRENKCELSKYDLITLTGAGAPAFSGLECESDVAFKDRLVQWREEMQRLHLKEANGPTESEATVIDEYLAQQSGFTLTEPILSRLLIAYRCNIETLQPKFLDEAFDLIDALGVFEAPQSSSLIMKDGDTHQYYASLLSIVTSSIINAMKKQNWELALKGLEVLQYRVSVILPGGVREESIPSTSSTRILIQKIYSQFLANFAAELSFFDSVPESLLQNFRASVQSCEQLHQAPSPSDEDAAIFAERVSIAAFYIVKFELPDPGSDDNIRFGLPRLQTLLGAVENLIDHNPGAQVHLTSMLICSLIQEARHVATESQGEEGAQSIAHLVEDAFDRLRALASVIPRCSTQHSSLTPSQSKQFNLAHRAVIYGMFQLVPRDSSEDAAKTLKADVDRAYSSVLAHKHHGLIVDAPLVSIFGEVMKETGDYRLFNLVDMCTVQCKQLIDEKIIEQLFQSCAVSGDSVRAKSLLDHLRRDYTGILSRLDPSTSEYLTELGITRKLPSHMFSKEFLSRWKQGGDPSRELVITDHATGLQYLPKPNSLVSPQQQTSDNVREPTNVPTTGNRGSHRDFPKRSTEGNQQAPAPEVWFCTKCNARNIGLKPRCYKCHAPAPQRWSSYRRDGGRKEQGHHQHHRDRSKRPQSNYHGETSRYRNRSDNDQYNRRK